MIVTLNILVIIVNTITIKIKAVSCVVIDYNNNFIITRVHESIKINTIDDDRKEIQSKRSLA